MSFRGLTRDKSAILGRCRDSLTCDRFPSRRVVLVAAAFLLVLVVAWVVVCLPAANRARERSPLTSTRLFKRGLELIGSETHGRFLREYGGLPQPSVAPPGAAARPRSVGSPAPSRVRWIPTLLLGCLAAAVVVTGALAVVRGGSLWEMHLATDGALAIFVSLLLEEKHRKMERKRKVRSIKARRPRTEEAVSMRLVAGAE